jgi:hypothetical protein
VIDAHARMRDELVGCVARRRRRARALPQPTDEELAARLGEPCTPSSDISTFITVDDEARRPRS